MLAPKYSDGVYSPPTSITGAPLPNARLLSLALYGETSLPDDFRTMAFLQWGQLVAHDMTSFLKANTTGNYLALPKFKLKLLSFIRAQVKKERTSQISNLVFKHYTNYEI